VYIDKLKLSNMNWKIKIIKAAAYIFLLMQIFSYLGSMKSNSNSYNISSGGGIAYFIGSNIFLIISIILFYYSYKLKEKMTKDKFDKEI